MYDIKSYHETKDSVIYLCFLDKREDELNLSLNANQHNQKTNYLVSLEKILNLLSVNYLTENITFDHLLFLISCEISSPRDNLLIAFLDNPYPPPKQIL
jgi:hypothetical protein